MKAEQFRAFLINRLIAALKLKGIDADDHIVLNCTLIANATHWTRTGHFQFLNKTEFKFYDAETFEEYIYALKDFRFHIQRRQMHVYIVQQ